MRIAILYLLVALLFIGCERNNATLTGPEETANHFAKAFNSSLILNHILMNMNLK